MAQANHFRQLLTEKDNEDVTASLITLTTCIQNYVEKNEGDEGLKKIFQPLAELSILKRTIKAPEDVSYKNYKLDLPVKMKCGKLTCDQVKFIASQCDIPIHLVLSQDSNCFESFLYIMNFWRYSAKELLDRLKQCGAADPNTNRFRHNGVNLKPLKILYNSQKIYPVSLEIIATDEGDRVTDWNYSVATDPVEVSIEDEDSEPIAPAVLDVGVAGFNPVLVYAHGSARYDNKAFDKCVIRNADEVINWKETVRSFAQLAMQLRLSESSKIDVFKKLIKLYAPIYSFNLLNSTLEELYEMMLRHKESQTSKERLTKELLKFKRVSGQPLVMSLTRIGDLYKRIKYPNSFEHMSTDPTKATYSLDLVEYLTNATLSLIEPDMAEALLECVKEKKINNHKIDIMELAKTVARAESTGTGGPKVDLYLYKKGTGALELSGTNKSVLTALKPIKKLNFVQTSLPHDEEEEDDYVERLRAHKMLQAAKSQQSERAGWTRLEPPWMSELSNTTVQMDGWLSSVDGPRLSEWEGNETILPSTKLFTEQNANATWLGGPSSVKGVRFNSTPITPSPLERSSNDLASTAVQLAGEVPHLNISGISTIPESPPAGSFRPGSQLDSTCPPGEEATKEMVSSPADFLNGSDGNMSGNASDSSLKMNTIIQNSEGACNADTMWLKAMAILTRMKQTEGPFIYDNYVKAKENTAALLEKFDGTDNFFKLGAKIFGILGYPRAPLNWTKEATRESLIKLNDVPCPVFWKMIFFNCESLSPIFEQIVDYVNQIVAEAGVEYTTSHLPINNLTTQSMGKGQNEYRPKGDRGTSSQSNFEGRQSRDRNRGRNRTSYRSRTSSGRRSEERDQSQHRRDKGFSPYGQRERSSNDESKRGVSPRSNHNPTERSAGTNYKKSHDDKGRDTSKSRLSIRVPNFIELECFPLICQGKQGNCKGDNCIKCGNNHPSHNCGYYLMFAKIPCKICKTLFHSDTECQLNLVTFPASKNE